MGSDMADTFESGMHLIDAAELGDSRTMVIGGFGGIALQAAAESGQQQAAKQLLAAGSALNRTNSEGKTALHAAAQHGDTGLVQLLVSAGAPLEAADELGCTPLLLAAQHGHFEVLEMLLQAGASVTAVDQHGGSAVWHAMYAPNQQSSLQCVELLLAAGAAVALRHHQRLTPLHKAANKGLDSVAQALLAAGADVDALTSTGHTPLWMATTRRSVSTVKVLLAAGAAVHAGDSPLCYAAQLAVQRPQHEQLVTFNCIMEHISASPAAAPPAVLIEASFAAACESYGRTQATTRACSIVRQLLLAATQQDAAAAAAALRGKLSTPQAVVQPKLVSAVKLLSCVLLELWLEYASDRATLDAQWPAVQQQMLLVVAKSRHEGQDS